jgi:hypothetical protein
MKEVITEITSKRAEQEEQRPAVPHTVHKSEVAQASPSRGGPISLLPPGTRSYAPMFVVTRELQERLGILPPEPK